jgi:hypothetical protein
MERTQRWSQQQSKKVKEDGQKNNKAYHQTADQRDYE